MRLETQTLSGFAIRMNMSRSNLKIITIHLSSENKDYYDFTGNYKALPLLLSTGKISAKSGASGTISYDETICSTCEMTYFCFPKDVAKERFFFNGCELEEE